MMFGFKVFEAERMACRQQAVGAAIVPVTEQRPRDGGNAVALVLVDIPRADVIYGIVHADVRTSQVPVVDDDGIGRLDAGQREHFGNEQADACRVTVRAAVDDLVVFFVHIAMMFDFCCKVKQKSGEKRKISAKLNKV